MDQDVSVLCRINYLPGAWGNPLRGTIPFTASIPSPLGVINQRAFLTRLFLEREKEPTQRNPPPRGTTDLLYVLGSDDVSAALGAAHSACQLVFGQPCRLLTSSA